MRRIQRLLRSATTVLATVGSLVAGAVVPVQADVAIAPSLVISQLKITSSNGQFVTLFNTTNTTLDMSKYQLEYFNSYDLSKATSSRLVALSGTLPPHSYFMVNDSTLMLCYQLTIDSLSLGFSSTAGLVEVLGFNQTSPGASVTPDLQDFVGWSKTAVVGAQTLPSITNAFLQRQPLDSLNNPSVAAPGVGSWQTVQPDTNNACKLISGSGVPTTVQTGLNQLLPSTEPPATIISLNDSDTYTASSTTAHLPDADIGLMAPQITELLPNPSGTGNDATDEYIELYNPNPVSFDLTGFALQSGITSLHSYNFPANSSLPAHSFTAFYAKTTGLSLSNTSGQVKLLDPFSNSISTTDAYSSAKDGQAWALAKSKWYWTASPSPNAANVIKQPLSKKAVAAAKSKAAKTTAGKVKAAKTTKKAKTTAYKGSSADQASNTPIHLWTLALIAMLALLYGAYEYRADLANRVHQFRRYLSARRGSRG